MNSDNNDIYNSGSEAESELDDDQHKKLIENVLNLSKKPKLKKPSRTEPTLQVSEFNLVKSSTGKKGDVYLKDLTKSLKKTSKHVKLGQQVDAVGKKTKTLSKPLEKPQADRIRRTIAYEETKKQLNRWDPIVTSNRAASTLKFPLNHDELKVDFNEKPEQCFKWGKTKLQIALEKVTSSPIIETIEVTNDEQEFPLTMEEMMEKRKETAKLRAVQSYKESKSRRQNKIKSKKFHKIERKAKAKQQLKEFEDLQKINPEAALMKLEELEKARAQERISLRHKSTGQWAKNKQIRAKYDKESRQALAEQLTISRDLTQKMKKTRSDSESDEENRLQQDASSINLHVDNPWTGNVKIKPNQEVETFVTNFKNFSNDQNKLDEQRKNAINTSEDVLDTQYDPSSFKNDVASIQPIQDDHIKKSASLRNKETPVGNKIRKTKNASKKLKDQDRPIQDIDIEPLLTDGNINEKRLNEVEKSTPIKLTKCSHVKKDKSKKRKIKNFDLGDVHDNSKSSRNLNKINSLDVHREDILGSTWIVSTLSEDSQTSKDGVIDDSELAVLRAAYRKLPMARKSLNKLTLKNTVQNSKAPRNITRNINKSDERLVSNNELDDIFDGLDARLRGKVQAKVNNIRNTNSELAHRNIPKSITKRKLEHSPKNTKSNFEMLKLRNERKRTRQDDGLHEGDVVDDEQQLADLKRLEEILKRAESSKKIEEIDPNKFINMKPVKLNTELPDMLVNEGDENDDSDVEESIRKSQKDVVSEAFCDDDIVDDFHRDKQKEIDKTTPKDTDLSMPGWGSWGGKNLKVSKYKRRRFILKAPKPEVRKDSNRGNLIINEDANNTKVAKHMVSDVPFPYKDVKEFEISLKTPIDGTFIPQTAFRKFIEPPVVTKMGTVIEPMTEDILLKKKKSYI